MMATCKNCGHKWGVVDTYKITMTNGGLSCSKCGKKQYLSTKSQQNLSLGWLTVLVIFLIPKLVELSNDKEPMW
jgi:CXXC-20-CXXC protein